MAFDEGFGGDVIDYGTYPDQGRAYFGMSEAKRTLAAVTKAGSMETAVYAGLDVLTNQLQAREWKRDGDGALLKIERMLIDAHYGKLTDTVEKFCQQSPHSAVLLPSHGMYVGAKSKPMREYQKRADDDRVGLNWRLRGVKGKRKLRHVVFDTNFWKTFTQARLSTEMGGKACMTLFGVKNTDQRKSQNHAMFIDHLLAETGTDVEAKGRRVTEWEWKPNRPDNDFLDATVGCHVAASIQGVTMIQEVVRTARRVRLSEKQKTAKVWRTNG
jgi:hypothetical protein